MLSQGLQWAWFTLSPLWQADWKLAPTGPGPGSARPLAYSTPGLHKVIILMTDGNDSRCGSYPSLWPECVQTDGYYNSYGRLSANYMNMAMPSGSPPASSVQASTNAGAVLDKLTSQACTAIKAKGITVYTTGFQAAAGSDAETVLKGCATDAAHYYNTNTGTDINNAFTLPHERARGEMMPRHSQGAARHTRAGTGRGAATWASCARAPRRRCGGERRGRRRPRWLRARWLRWTRRHRPGTCRTTSL